MEYGNHIGAVCYDKKLTFAGRLPRSFTGTGEDIFAYFNAMANGGSDITLTQAPLPNASLRVMGELEGDVNHSLSSLRLAIM